MDSPLIAEDSHSKVNHHDTAAVSPNPLKCPPPPQYHTSTGMKYPLAPPLGQVSPERLNQQRLPHSPSLHSYLVDSERPRTRDSMTSDVQSKIAFLNSLAGTTSLQSSPTRPGQGVGGSGLNGSTGGSSGAVLGGNGDVNSVNGTNALQMAVMGYEEAQASLATMTAELERAREELASRKKRERLLAQRVEDLLEELQAEKEKRARDQESYTKEVKRCRKEAYRAELAVVEARQDLQEVRGELKRCQAEVQHEKAEKEKSRQESFERAYALAGTVGELEQLKDQLKAVEKERDAALLELRANTIEKSTVQENQETQAEDMCLDEWRPRFTAQETTSSMREVDSAVRQPTSVLSSFESIKFRLDYHDKKMQGLPVTPQEEIRFLKEELRHARSKHVEDADLIHFMHMQCQFMACPCRMAEKNGERFIHDHEYEAMLQQARSSKKRKISNGPCGTTTGEMATEESAEQPKADEDMSSESTSKERPEETHFGELPPDPTPEMLSGVAEEPRLLDQAVEIPLPPAQHMELETREETPEPTAQLEEITQVLVEPGTTSKPFSFSTSTTSNPPSRATAQPLRQAERASATLEQDLFDLSPPKHAPPRRPSTAMGILTIESPIRLVPDSPRSVRASRREITRSNTPVYPLDHSPTQSMTMTTKVALKGSPPRDSLHRRAQSRPTLPSLSPLASSVMFHMDEERAFNKENSTSPAPDTLFPVTPLHKHARSMHNLAQHHPIQPETQTDSYTRPWSPPQTIATTTTTTRVPLRGFEDADAIPSPGRANTHRRGYEHAHTEVLNVDVALDMNGTISNTQPYETNMIRPLQTSSSSILGNIPGTPISREAALAQIRARRDRARSINLKRSTDGNGNGNLGRGTNKSPSKPKPVNGGMVGGLFARDKENAYGRREISQASAPGRFAY